MSQVLVVEDDESIAQLLEFTATSADRAALQELSALVCLLQTRLHTRTLRKLAQTINKLVNFDARFATLFEQVWSPPKKGKIHQKHAHARKNL